MITHTTGSYWISSQKKTAKIFQFLNKLYMRHTFWSCLIRCTNMIWIQWVLLKIQSRHYSVHRQTDGLTYGWTDGQSETSIPLFQLRLSRGYNKQCVYFTAYTVGHTMCHLWFPSIGANGSLWVPEVGTQPLSALSGLKLAPNPYLHFLVWQMPTL